MTHDDDARDLLAAAEDMLRRYSREVFNTIRDNRVCLVDHAPGIALANQIAEYLLTADAPAPAAVFELAYTWEQCAPERKHQSCSRLVIDLNMLMYFRERAAHDDAVTKPLASDGDRIQAIRATLRAHEHLLRYPLDEPIIPAQPHAASAESGPACR